MELRLYHWQPKGKGQLMYEVMIEEEFSAAHALRGYRGKCENLHGHNWKVEVYVRGDRLDSVGLLVDFKELKTATRQVMRYLDHKNLNELRPFDTELNPSSEHIAGFILHKVAEQINNERIKVYKVRVWETPSTSATIEIHG
jgi:6-pyruvoyltetrahydropterin/6-carboxytetrahydropterin synthase